MTADTTKSAQVLDGRATAAAIKAELTERVAALKAKGVTPGLGTILVGSDPGSTWYVGGKHKDCAEVGITSIRRDLPETTTQDELLAVVRELNGNPECTGYIVQLPLPKHIDSARVLESIAPAKDVDGFHEANLGALLAGAPRLVPCTPAGVMRLLEHAGIPLSGRRAVVIGRSNIVGKPLALLLLQKDASVTICHSKSGNLAEFTRNADILVAAVGRAKLVTGAMVKPGACVIDVGVNRLPDGKLAGDVDFETVKDVAGWITPVPGGVGPMTIAMLLENCVNAASR
jgi:methylenetetrahydrofolate dehydrogenase (NADP+)/methenyltetrahydrofolate cyclohydrolase